MMISNIQWQTIVNLGILYQVSEGAEPTSATTAAVATNLNATRHRQPKRRHHRNHTQS